MPHPALWLVGLELHRFSPAADPAASVARSLSAGAEPELQLAAYEGPALQPYAGLRARPFAFILAPSLSLHEAPLDGEDVRSREGRLEGRARWEGGRWFVGADLAVAGGSTQYAGQRVASSAAYFEAGPTVGAIVALGPHVGFVARARWPLRWEAAGASAELTGALGMEWRP